MQRFGRSPVGEANSGALLVISDSVIKFCHSDVINIDAHSKFGRFLEFICGLSIDAQFLFRDVAAESHATRFHWSFLESLCFEAAKFILIGFFVDGDLGWVLCWYFKFSVVPVAILI